MTALSARKIDWDAAMTRCRRKRQIKAALRVLAYLVAIGLVVALVYGAWR